MLLRDGRILLLLRDNVSRDPACRLTSDDGGVVVERSVTDRHRGLSGRSGRNSTTGGSPASPADARAPFGIRALHLPRRRETAGIRPVPTSSASDLPNRDLGYPSLALRADGSLYVVYYAQDSEGITGIHGSVLMPDAEGWRQEGLAYGQG